MGARSFPGSKERSKTSGGLTQLREPERGFGGLLASNPLIKFRKIRIKQVGDTFILRSR